MPDRLPASVMPRLAALVVCLAPVVMAQQAEVYRQWTSADGKKVEAALVGVEGDSAKLKLRTGAVVPVPLARLSAEDQAFAKQAAPAASGAAPPSLRATTLLTRPGRAPSRWPTSRQRQR